MANLNPVPNKAPVDEVEIYRAIVYNAVRQLGILKTYDANFIFLETQWIMHLQQLDATIGMMKEHAAAQSN